MKLKKYQMFIDGEWLDSDTKKTFKTLNPENNEPWAEAPVSVIPYPPVCGVPTKNLTGLSGSCIFLIAFCLSSVVVPP